MGKKVSELIEATEVNKEDLIPIIQNGVSKKAKASLIAKERRYRSNSNSYPFVWLANI